MGIGNTTSASAIIAAITRQPVERVTGRGTGIDPAHFQHKVSVIQQALNLHQPQGADTLAKVGGFEIGALAGLMLEAAAHRVPVMVDGLIATSAALIAAQIEPNVRDYLIAGHIGVEPGHRIALEHLGLTPLLELDLRLGEGTGAVLALPLVEASMRTLQEMATFDDAGVSGPA
jgi:nicotinate-nucleotide--dimethylbenzimidazole phosphoribosyltransferase